MAGALAACGGRRESPAAVNEAAPASNRRDVPDPPAPRPAVRIPDETTQLVTAIVPDWSATTAELQLWTRENASASWRPDGAPWSSVIGRSGLAWGRGRHGEGIPAGRSGLLKREGDGKSPAGIFAIGRAFGYAAAPPAGVRLPYTTVDESWRCVDDPASAYYTQILSDRTVTPDWDSTESMRRDDDLYEWVVEIRHNPFAVPHGGSCIFLHVWSGAGGHTVGCTAMPEPTLASLLATLDPARAPLFVILPRPEYDALAPAWSLPR